MNTAIKRLQSLPQQGIYWLFYILAGITLLSTALYYQFVLEALPCVVCIQIRLWISALILVAMVGAVSRNQRLMRIISNFFIVVIAAGLSDRSYLLLGTERGFIFADCGFDAGLPTWFAVEQWLPWLYRIETSCGYTPELIFGITMAETLMLLSVLLLVVGTLVFLASLLDFRKQA